MKLTYLILAIAIAAEVLATSTLKASEQFTRLVPRLVVLTGYIISFYLVTIVLKTIPIGITYAIWSGMGIVLVAVMGSLFYKQMSDVPAIIGMGMIVGGVVIIHLFSKTIG